MKLAPDLQFHSVQESDDLFLSLWPHRYDYLQAEHPNPGEPPDWRTEKRYPLSDRLIRQGAYLFGVRFGKTTNYALLDIDAASVYHPSQDPCAIQRILEALEPLGITHSIPLQSSSSGGIHLYLPFEHAQKSYLLAEAIQALLNAKGFKLASGQLELFPNPRPYVPYLTPPLYNGHRLPLQNGSYLLDEDFQLIYSPQREFVKRWKFCQHHNQVKEKKIQKILRIYKRKSRPITKKASEFFNDLQTEIERGWEEHGQTNRLLGRIAMREYIFGHIINNSAPFEGKALTERIVEVAIALPGYTEWCRHQHEIYERASEWARNIERSERYYHYGYKTLNRNQSQSKIVTITWNQKQKQNARAKIWGAIADLLNRGILPSQTTKRANALSQYGISNTTLYKHKDLWHPDHLNTDSLDLEEPVSANLLEPSTSVLETQSDPNSILTPEAQRPAENYTQSLTSLLEHDGCNTLQEVSSSDLHQKNLKTGCNTEAKRSHLDAQRTNLIHLAQPHYHFMQPYWSSNDPKPSTEALGWAIPHPSMVTDTAPRFF